MPLRQGTTFGSDDAVPEIDPTTTAGLLTERLQAWKHAVVYLEDYVGAVEKVHKVHAKEYEKVLKTISHPLREGHHFDQGLGGVAGFFENMRVNTQALVNSNTETEKTLKGTVLPILERLHKEIKAKHKEVSHGADKGAKEIEKARNATQKHIELLGQHSASFESTGGKLHPTDDPYVLKRGVIHRLNKQIIAENNHSNDLLHVQEGFQAFEAHIIQVVQEVMEAFNQVAGGQAEKTRALYADMLGAAQRIPGDFEWKGFTQRNAQRLVNPNDPPRSLDAVTFANQDHGSTKPLIEGSLERKSRNKLSWGTQSAYYVVTPSKYLHEFKDDDNLQHDPKPELSIYLPDAVIGVPNGDKFNVKGKDRGKSFSSKLAGTSELAFKAHSPADAQKWFEAISVAAGSTGSMYESTPGSPIVGTESHGSTSSKTSKVDSGHKEQEAGITGAETVSSPTAMSPTEKVASGPTTPANEEKKTVG
ncbi:PH domain-containing protein [Xylaria bambusicola]|uniref:PH domain-containing protein n=1 Tax=Xylaria bambusicola TaxID=326684 RepID=UPI002007CDA0|nr:PH domain-containing protein [Xylaria bambusicola]KAI0514955.1 PH domain-containing protein [Xylaria bambusicola]